MHSRISPAGNMIILAIWNCPYYVTISTATKRNVPVAAKQDHL